MLMSLGTLVVAAEQRASNFILFVVQNATYEITGNQLVPGGANVDFALLARGSGFPSTFSFDDAETYRRRLPEVFAAPGPVAVVVRTEPGREVPLARGPSQTIPYLQTSLAEAAHRLRAVLAGAGR
jgi:thiamine pyrophosphate-dependent acetolactate synthase large subunit-like protein